MSDSKYIAARQQTDPERERLSLLERLADPWTTDRLLALGVTEGWNCAEVAAGAGSITRWLAARVGTSGDVVATDTDIRFLSTLDLPNVEVREHDIVKQELEGAYDLVHTRALLLHLQAPMVALEHMTAALKPGGWLFVEDLDVDAIRAADASHPEAGAFEARVRADNATFDTMGIFDPSSGLRVPSMMEELGLVDVGHIGLCRIARGGSDIARFMALGAQLARPLLVGHAGVPDAELDAQVARLQDPTFTFREPTTYQCWGRRAP